MTVIDDPIPNTWSHLAQLLPAILSENNPKEDAKSHYSLIKKTCDDAGFSAQRALEKLSDVVSALIKEAKDEQSATTSRNSVFEDDLGLSSSSDEDEASQHEKENKSIGKSILEGEQLSTLEFCSYIEDPDNQNNFLQFLERFKKFEEEDEAEKTTESNAVQISRQTSTDQDDDIQIIYEDGNDSDIQDLDQVSVYSVPISPLEANITDTFESPYFNQPTQSTSSKPTCACCGIRVSKRSVTHCRPCSIIVNAKKKRDSLNVRQTDQPICNSCGSSVSSRSKGLCRSCNWGHFNKNNSSGNNSLSLTPRTHIPFDPIEGSREARLYKIPSTRVRIICIRCNNDRVKFAQQMCQICYKAYRKENNLIVVKRESFDDTLPSKDLSFQASTSTSVPSTFLRQPKLEIENYTPVEIKRPKLQEEPVVEQENSTPVRTEEKAPRRNRKTNKCTDCQIAIYPESERCKDCHYIHKKSDKGNLSSTLDSSTRSDRKFRDCLRCHKRISMYGRSGYCHQCFFDQRKEDEQKSSTKNDKRSAIVEKGSTCLVCQKFINRRSETGTCSMKCYRHFHSTKKAQNQTDATDAAVENEVPPVVQISEEDIKTFAEDPLTCQSCWSFEKLNQRRLCVTCHEKEYSDAEKASSTANKSVLEMYLEQTEHYLNDN